MRKLSNKGQALLAILSMLLFPHAIARDTLIPTQPLSFPETLVSSNGTFALGFFTPRNSTNYYVGIWYNNINAHTVVWVANRETPLTNSSVILSISTNGSLAISPQNSSFSSIIITPPSVLSNPVAKLLDDGNLVIMESGSDFNDNRSYVWQSFDYPTDTLLPGMKLGWNLTSGLDRNLTCWKSDSDPAQGPFTLAMDTRGDPQLAFWSGSKRGWRSGPWTGYQFSGIPETRTYTAFDFHFLNNKEEVFYIYTINDPSFITRLVMNQSGTVQRFVWLDGPGEWSLYWYTPKTPCDSYAPCGPYGTCDPNGSPICGCLTGFVPKSPKEWALRDGSDGCVRETQLDCRNRTDGFMTVSNVLLPDTVNVTVDMNMSLEECQSMCLMNCSCTGYSNADVRNGGTGCITWQGDLMDLASSIDGGQNLYVRLAASDLKTLQSQSQSGKKKREARIAVVSVLLVLVLLISLAAYVWRRKKRQGTQCCCFLSVPDSSDEQYIVERTENEDLELPLFGLEMVVAATNNFSFENKLGEGGFGPVYRGKLDDGQEIAVKTLSKTSIQGTDEFKNEVMLIAKLQHRNLVSLLGCCIHGEERILIYEYLPNKSLDAFLFDKERRGLLDWRMRYRIIEGIARGLLYLHQDSRFRIIHRDLKASNILLDKEMNPKISDFGMARIFGGDQTKAMTLRVVGTYGYMSPEYAMDGIFSVKSDVFSFGVLMLEIISGTRNRGVYLSDPDQYLLGRAWNLWREGNGFQLVDSAIGHSYSMNEVLRCIKIGLLCVQEHPEDRPTMSSVVLMLASEDAAIPEPRQPGFVLRKGYSEADSSSSKPEFQSGNDLTFTMSVGR